jgi:porin
MRILQISLKAAANVQVSLLTADSRSVALRCEPILAGTTTSGRMKKTYIAIVAAPVGGSLLAQELPPAREWIGGAAFSDWTRCAGDLGGWRTDLEGLGIELSGGYVADWAAPWSGDAGRRSSYVSLLDFNIAFDLESLVGLPKTLAYVDAYSIAGRQPSNDVGDFQGLSNIQSTRVEQIAEAWVETWLSDVRIKAGKVDFNSEFAVNESGGEFINSSAAVPSTIVAYPTYPNPAMALNLFYHPTETFYVGVAVYDGANGEGVNTGTLGPGSLFSGSPSDALFYAAEVGVAWPGGGEWGAGRFSIGAFHHTAKFSTFAGGIEQGTEGLWASVEQRVWRENPTQEDEQGVAVFATVGLADDSVSACGTSIAAGLAWIGPLRGRDDDVLGVGVFHCDLSNELGAGTPKNETAWEAFYKVQVTPAINIKPEVQYIMHPGGVAGVDDALVALLRFEFLF